MFELRFNCDFLFNIPKLNFSLQQSHLPKPCDGIDVPVANSGHGDHHPVDPGGDGGEARGLALLNEVAEAGEAEAGDEDEHQHEAQLPEALSDGVHYGLEAGRVSAKLKDSSQLEYSENLTTNKCLNEESISNFL